MTNRRGEAGQHDTYGFALDMAQPDKSKGRPDISPGSKPICAAACPQPGFPAAPVPVNRYFATGDSDPCFITDISLTARRAPARTAAPSAEPYPASEDPTARG